ncbi:hypothetical protein CGRA01v4_09430 [Colletotrichum graminicola]|nr:hypothetical protein CGRA01v4_09430 [Colletotrichum graminicola]
MSGASPIASLYIYINIFPSSFLHGLRLIPWNVNVSVIARFPVKLEGQNPPLPEAMIDPGYPALGTPLTIFPSLSSPLLLEGARNSLAPSCFGEQALVAFTLLVQRLRHILHCAGTCVSSRAR